MKDKFLLRQGVGEVGKVMRSEENVSTSYFVGSHPHLKESYIETEKRPCRMRNEHEFQIVL